MVHLLCGPVLLWIKSDFCKRIWILFHYCHSQTHFPLWLWMSVCELNWNCHGFYLNLVVAVCISTKTKNYFRRSNQKLTEHKTESIIINPKKKKKILKGCFILEQKLLKNNNITILLLLKHMSPNDDCPTYKSHQVYDDSSHVYTLFIKCKLSSNSIYRLLQARELQLVPRFVDMMICIYTNCRVTSFHESQLNQEVLLWFALVTHPDLLCIAD